MASYCLNIHAKKNETRPAKNVPSQTYKYVLFLLSGSQFSLSGTLTHVFLLVSHNEKNTIHTISNPMPSQKAHLEIIDGSIII